MELLVGSIIVPAIKPPLEPRFSIPQANIGVTSQNPKQPPPLPLKHFDKQVRVLQEKERHPSSPKLGKESNLALSFKGSYPCRPIHKFLNKPCVSFDSQEKDRLLANMGHIVIVKFTHLRPKFSDFKSFLQKLNFQGAYKIIEFDFKHIFIDFVIFEDCVKLWILKNIVICGFRGRLFMWDSDFKPSIESPFAPIWIHLPQFPLYLFDEHAMLSVASLFGKPVHIDLGCLGHDKVGVMSFCVFKDVRVQGPSEFYVEFVGNGILVERFLQVVLYGTIPEYCTYCLHMGHALDDCKVRMAAASREKDKVLETDEQGPQKVISLPSVFNRLQLDLKDKAGRQLVDDGLLVMEQVMDGEVMEVQVKEGTIASSSSLQDNIPSLIHISDSFRELPLCKLNSDTSTAGQTSKARIDNILSKDHVGVGKEVDTDGEKLILEDGKSVDASLKFSDSFTDPLLEASNLFPGAVEQGFLVGASGMLSKDVVQADIVVDSGGEDHVILGTSPADKPISHNSDSSVALCLEPSNRSSGGVEQGSLTKVAYILSTEEEGTDRAEKLKVGGLAILGEKPDDAVQNSDSGYDSSAVPSSSSLNSNSRIVDQDLLLGVDSILSKVHVRADKDLETTGKELDIVAETSAGEGCRTVEENVLSPSIVSLTGTSGDVIRWLGKNVGQLIQDNLQLQDFGQSEKGESAKVVIKHPVTKEIIRLSPKTNSTGSSAPKSLVGLSKNAKKKWKKKNKKLATLQPSFSTDAHLNSIETLAMSEAGTVSNTFDTNSPLPICVSSQQDWNGLDSNGSKDTPFWTNFHAAQEDLSQLERPEEYPYMFTLDSEDERLSSSINSSNLDSQSSKDSGPGELDLQQLQNAYHSAADFIEDVAFDEPQPQSVESFSSEASKAEEQVTPSTQVQPATTIEVEQNTPSTQVQPAATKEVEVQVTKEIESQEQLDHLPLLEAYHKGHFDVQVTPSKETEDASNASKNKEVSTPPSTQISWAQEVEAVDALTVGDLYETIPYDKELVVISGGGVVSYPCPWINSEDRDLLPEEHDLIHKLVTQYPFEFSMSGVPIEGWYQVDAAKASKKFHKEQFEPP